MPAGTIALTNNSTTVTGTGTNFSTELKANDFLVAIVGGVTYTLGVQSVNSATGLTLITAYNGPTATGVAWTAVPNAALVGITAQVAADVAKAIRGLNLDKANWQQVYSASGNITVTLPDGSTYTGPSWNSVVNSVGGKLDKTGGTMTGPLTAAAIEMVAATPFIDFHFGSSAADYTARLIADANQQLTVAGQFDASRGFSSRAGTEGARDLAVPWNFFWNYGGTIALHGFVGTTRLGTVTFASTSDRELKTDIQYASDRYSDEDGGDANEAALKEVLQWKPAFFKMKKRGIIPETEEMLGYIANDLVTVSPECVSGEGLPKGYDLDENPNPESPYSLNQIPMIVKLSQSIQAQQKMINDQSEIMKAMGVRLKDLDGLDG